MSKYDLLRRLLTVDAFREVLKMVPSPERIVCLGLGSLVDGEAGAKRISEVQLALLIELNKLFDVLVLSRSS